MTIHSEAPRDVSVVIPAYSEERWELTCAAISSALAQSLPPREIIVCVDHNPELRDRFRANWKDNEGPPVRIIDSKYPGHQGASRTTAVEEAFGFVIAFLDDDATAELDWLERLTTRLAVKGTVAVGGAPIPIYSTPRPSWFPFEFDWIFGCRYYGLPVEAASVKHLIGTTMAARRPDIIAVGGFHSDDFDDLDICHRLLHAYPDSEIIYDPGITVNHYVHANRLTWHYFWWRCFSVNRLKVAALRQMGSAANLDAERAFALQIVTRGVRREFGSFVRGDLAALARAFAILFGLSTATIGYIVGRIEWTVNARRASD